VIPLWVWLLAAVAAFAAAWAGRPSLERHVRDLRHRRGVARMVAEFRSTRR
jgi:hypothetical protein